MKMSDDERYELLNGELVMAAAPLLYHQYILRKLLNEMSDYIDERNLGELYSSPADVVLSDTDVVQPDILFVSRQRSHILTRENIHGAPDLVVEVLSPRTARLDRVLKLNRYAEAGVREYWLVDRVAGTIELRVNDGGRFVAHVPSDGSWKSPVVTGIELDVDALWAGMELTFGPAG